MLATVLIAITGLFIGYLFLTRKTKFTSKYKYIKQNASNFVPTKSNAKHFTSSASDSVDIKFSAKGIGSAKESPPITIFELFFVAIKKNADSAMLAKEYLIPGTNSYKWKYLSRSEVEHQVLSAARAFISLGLKPWESVCIMGFNSPEWVIADMAAIFAGGLAVGLYATNNVGECQYIINNCKARIIVVENELLLKKFIQIKDNNMLNNVSSIIIYDDIDMDIAQYDYNDLNIMLWNDLIMYGSTDCDKYNDIMFKRHKEIKPSNCCTLIYTSGTTGTPKGVMLSHDNVLFMVKSILSSQKHIEFWGNNAVRHRIISYLPLSHIAAQCLDIYGPLVIGFHGGDGCIYFARNDALKGSLINTLKFVSPTVFLGVPRVWEKMEEKMRLIGKKGSMIVKFISKNAKAIGLAGAYNRELDGNKDIPLLYGFMNKLIFSNIKRALGFSDLQLAITGSAPIKASTLQYFHSLGIFLIEGYGLSESSALITMGLEYHNKIGSVGPPLLGIHVKIDDINNEIYAKGRNIMMGYINDLSSTKSAFTDDGYFKTGDIGKFDTRYNLLYITGRIKELIITSGGENIAPIPIEHHIKTILSGISDCCLQGNQRKYLTLLITLKTKPEDGVDLDGDAADVDMKCKTIDDAKKSQIWEQYIKNGIKRYNENMEQCVSRAQRIQYFRILDRGFSEKTGEMTSTLKLKRSLITHKFKDIIDTMY